MRLSEHFSDLSENYLFSDISKKLADYKRNHPFEKVIRMDIGDVTRPLPAVISDAMKLAAEETANKSTFRGYSNEHGYDFLRTAIADYYKRYNVNLDKSEISVSDGAKSDLYAIPDMFASGIKVLIPDPSYPVYADSNIIKGNKIYRLPTLKENGFTPIPPDFPCDLVYLCSPSNPTGEAYSKETLKKWVEYAYKFDAVIIFDAAYSSYISSPDCPHSIYEIDGADKCAIEVCSFSKNFGFTGIRCGYTVIPRKTGLLPVWNRIKSIRSNGVSYITQRGAESALTDIGISKSNKNIEYYKDGAKLICDTLSKLGIKYYGGENSPYVFFECPENESSVSFFEKLLQNCRIISTPGIGFGKCGEGMIRLSAFASHSDICEAMDALCTFCNTL